MEEMRKLAGGDLGPFRIFDLEEAAQPFPIRFDSRSARVRAFSLFLLSLEPLSLREGSPLSAKELLRNQSYKALPYVDVRGKKASSPGNRLLLGNEKSSTIKIQLQNLFPTKKTQRKKILKSHAIPEDAYERLLENDFDSFIEIRERHLRKVERDFIKSCGVPPPDTEDSAESLLDADD